MSVQKRFFIFYLPALCFLALTFIHFFNNRIYFGESLASLPAGEYTLLGRRCIEADLGFDYLETNPDNYFKDHELMVDWLYFDGAIERRFIIDDQAITMAFGDKSCMVFDRVNIFENANGKFSYSGTTVSKVAPEGCSLRYTFKGKNYETKQLVGSKDAGPALSTDNMVTHLIYKKDNLFLLYESAENDYSDFGCHKKDRLVLMLMKL